MTDSIAFSNIKLEPLCVEKMHFAINIESGIYLTISCLITMTLQRISTGVFT